jgi:hypothetical protein
VTEATAAVAPALFCSATLQQASNTTILFYSGLL